MASRPTVVVAILALLAIMVVPLIAYIGGYFWLGKHCVAFRINKAVVSDMRVYPHLWQVKIFRPAGKVESWLMGVQVEIRTASGEEF